MKTDSQLQRDVIDELTSDPRVGNAEIGVSVKDGVVTLTGFVDTYARKIAAEQAVERLGGVRAVAEDLTWLLCSIALPLVVVGALTALAAVPVRRNRRWPELAEYGGFER